MKKEYMKPELCVVELRHRTMMLSGSPVKSTHTNLAPDDVIEIDEDTPAGTNFWGR